VVRERREPASLAWVVLEAADDGDAAAAAIVADLGAALGRTALAAARRVGIEAGDAFGLALTGGVLRHGSSALRDRIVATVRAAAPRVDVRESAPEPVAGAVLLAFDTAGLSADATVRERIRMGLAAADLYDTHPARTGAR
jgi:N-acetylglucosamine kinase-like BadF-type ATPase